jgi:hypothetical protein
MALTVRREQGAAAVLNIPEELGVKVLQLLVLGLQFAVRNFGFEAWDLEFGGYILGLRIGGGWGVRGWGFGIGLVTYHTRRHALEALGHERCHRDDVKQTWSCSYKCGVGC